FRKTALLQAFQEGFSMVYKSGARSRIEKADHRPRRLLRAHTKRPRSYCAPEERDEVAAGHSMTSSASARSWGGIVRPSVFAVLRLMTISNLVGCITGSSP